MLRKLLKHEFRATGRIMGPMYLILLALSVGANVSVRLLAIMDSRFLNILGGLVLTLFSVGIMAVCIVTLVLMINRFRTNLLGDEGYIMFTLPASVHQQVWSKIIVSTVWFAATAVAVCLAALILVFRVAYVDGMVDFIYQIMQQITAYYAINGVAFILEFIALCWVAVAACCLEFYAAMALGHSFANHKTLLSIAFFIGFQIILQIVGLTSLLSFDGFNFNGIAAAHAFMALCIAACVLEGAVFYVITTQTLKRRLNLE